MAYNLVVHCVNLSKAEMSHYFDSPLIIACMSRSGSSLTTSLLQSAGLDVGENFLAPFKGAENGLFENLDFVHFHKELLTSLGQPVQGWVSEDLPDIDRGAKLQARQLIARNQKNVPWGWKDPRNTLFLDMWNEVLPSARYLFVIRKPWEVIDSLYRRGDEAFIHDPSFALEVWTHYNSKVVAFSRQYPERSLIVDIESVLASPGALVDELNQRFKYGLKEPAANLIDGNLLKSETSSLELIVQTHFPEAYLLWENVSLLAQGCASGASNVNKRPLSPQRLLNVWQHMRSVEADLKNTRQGLENEMSQFRAAISASVSQNTELKNELDNKLLQRLHDSTAANLRAETAGLEGQIAISRSFFSKSKDSPAERLRVARQIFAIARTQYGKSVLTIDGLLSVLKTARMLRLARHTLLKSGLFDQAFYLCQYSDVRESSIDPSLHYLVKGAAEGRFPNPLFDTRFYASQLDQQSVNPLIHFIETGGKLGLKPHPLFDSLYYLQSNPDVASAGMNPLAHYLLYGDCENRKPNANFVPAFYRLESSVIAPFTMATLCHYALIGAKHKLPTEAARIPFQQSPGNYTNERVLQHLGR